MADLQKFFKRNKIEIEKVLYIYHCDRKTIVCQEPGREAFSSAPLQEILAFLPEEDFISISRNAIVRRDKILNISYPILIIPLFHLSSTIVQSLFISVLKS